MRSSSIAIFGKKIQISIQFPEITLSDIWLSPWNPDKDDDWNVVLALQAAVEEQGKAVSLEKCQQFYNDNKKWHDDTGAQIVYWLRTSANTV